MLQAERVRFHRQSTLGRPCICRDRGPLDPETLKVTSQDPQEQTHQALDNLERVLNAAGLDLDDVVKANVFLTDIDVYDEVNEAYMSRFQEPYPARSCVEVARLPVEIIVEIELVAERPAD